MNQLHAFVINLEKSTQRWKNIINQFNQYIPSIIIERFPAIYGPSLSKNFLHQYVDAKVLEKQGKRGKNNPEVPHIAAIGCYLSHVGVWRKIVELKYPYALVLEDDIKLLQPNFDRQISILLRKVPNNWDIIFVEDIKHLHPPKNINGELGLLFQIPTYHICAAGYIITSKAAQSLLKTAFPINYQVDNYMAKCNLQKYSLIYPLLTQDHLFDQDNNEFLQTNINTQFQNNLWIPITIGVIGIVLFIIFLTIGILLLNKKPII